MKYKTLFRLALKVIGIYIAIESLQTLSYFVTQAYFQFIRSSSPFPNWEWIIPQGISGAIQLLLGIYLFFGGKWIANLAVPSDRPYCQECAYDLTGAAATRCPECGTPFRWEEVLPAGHASASTLEAGKDASDEAG